MECQINALVSIIVPCHNTKEMLLYDCLYSLHEQSYSNLEIIVVDDGSDAEYAAMYDKLISRMDDNDMIWKCCHNVHGGVSAARNKGMDLSNGEYVCFLDSDDYVNIDFIRILLEMLVKTGVPVAHCEMVCTYKTEAGWTCGIDGMPEYKVFQGLDVFKNCNGYVTPKMYNKKLIQQEQIRFQEGRRIGEDLLFVANVCERVLISVGTKAQLYYYRLNAWSTTNKMTAKDYNQHTEAFQYLLTIPCIAEDAQWFSKEIRIQSYCKLKRMTATIREKEPDWRRKYKDYRREYLENTAEHIVIADGMYKWMATKSLKLGAGWGMMFLISYDSLKNLYMAMKNCIRKLRYEMEKKT